MTFANFQPEYAWLDSESAPRHLVVAIGLAGILEDTSSESNPVILGWASEVGGWISSFYQNDATPWCGLFMAYIMKRAGRPWPNKALAALAWSGFGVARVGPAMLGDVLVFTRKGGGHVGLYVGEDDTTYHVLGGNTADAVKVARLAKSRIYAIRHPEYSVGQPPNVRRIFLKSSGEISTNEQ